MFTGSVALLGLLSCCLEQFGFACSLTSLVNCVGLRDCLEQCRLNSSVSGYFRDCLLEQYGFTGSVVFTRLTPLPLRSVTCSLAYWLTVLGSGTA